MKYLQFYKKSLMRIFSVLFSFMFTATTLLGQSIITHNIGTQGDLVIPGISTSNYVITGTTTVNTIIIQSGYNGTITLDNVDILSTRHTTAFLQSGYSCITVEGDPVDDANLSPVTKVNFILKGTNTLRYSAPSTATYGLYCALQVNRGSQIHISAIDPNDNASGTLYAKVDKNNTPDGNGAAIGAASCKNSFNFDSPPGSEGPANIICSSGNPRTYNAAGGNIIISSGTITAIGAHSAGIGGARFGYFDGAIIITGGDVTAKTEYHSAGIGSGCSFSGGLDGCYTSNSSIIVLPPAKISSMGSSDTHPEDPSWALAGANYISYVNDPIKPLMTIRTVDYEPNVPIYLDLTTTPGLKTIFDAIYPEFELNKVRIGSTDNTGIIQLHGLFQNLVTFFTTASSTTPATFGRPYLPVVTTVPNGGTIELPLLDVDLRFTDQWAYPLIEGYTTQQARDNAYRLKVEYYSATPITNVTWKLQDGIDFHDLIFYAADGVTQIPAPTTINTGAVFYVKMPIVQGKLRGNYNDVLLIGLKWSTIPAVEVRKICRQRVVFDDSNTNNHFCVSASPMSFSVPYPSSNTVTLNLRITHNGMNNVAYEPLDVLAWYYISKSPTYAGALAEKPHYEWTPLNIPLTNGGIEQTTLSFSSVPAGDYYIHWFAESGVAFAHSIDVTSPPSSCGGFGPYSLTVLRNVLRVNPHLRSYFVH